MIKLRGAAFGFAVLVLVAACGSSAGSSSAGSSGLTSQDSSAPDASVPLAADSVATYRAYLEQNADLLVQRTKPFVDAVVAGKIPQAKALYAAAREPYERIEPVAGVFGDLDPAIDALESDIPAGGTFSGFHRLERALWQQNTTAGMAPVAKKLLADVIQVRPWPLIVDQRRLPTERWGS